MCGIVAIISSCSNGFTDKERKAFTDMLFVDTLRGWDSTGVFSVDYDGDVNILKAAMTGPNFINTQEYGKWHQELWSTGIMAVGHNRAATRGTVNDTNAHPFWVDDNIVLVQNGTWNGSHKHVKDTEVDTEALAHLIHEGETVEKALQKIDAAYALIWFNVKEKTLYAIHNFQRPLCIAYAKEGTVFLASEVSTILFAASRQNIPLSEAPYEIKPGLLCSWKLDNKEVTESHIDVDYLYKGPSFRQHHKHYTEWDNYGVTQADLLNYDRAPVQILYSSNDSDNNPEDRHSRITKTIYEHIQHGAFKKWEMSVTSAREIEKDLSIRPRDKRLVVEFVDYLACNYHPSCNKWYVIGYPVTVNEDECKPLIYSIVPHKTEMEMVDMLANDGLFSVVLRGNQLNHVNGNYVVSCYSDDLTKIETKNESTTDQNAPPTTH